MVNREDDRMDRKGDIETDDVPELLGELRIVRQLERPDTMRRELVASRMSRQLRTVPGFLALVVR